MSNTFSKASGDAQRLSFKTDPGQHFMLECSISVISWKKYAHTTLVSLPTHQHGANTKKMHSCCLCEARNEKAYLLWQPETKAGYLSHQILWNLKEGREVWVWV